MKRILITGGAGFIGSHSADLFLEQGWNVTVYDNLSSGKLTNLDLFNSRLEMVQADILDYAKLSQQIARCDAVLHLAAQGSVPQSIVDPLHSLKVNTQGFLHILQAIREVNKPIRLVYASSAAIYGSVAQLPCSDEGPLPIVVQSPYALEKANCERYADLYMRLFGIKSLGLRYFNAYGERQDPHSTYASVISKFIANYKKREPIIIFGDGEQSRDFIHVSDVARANLLAVTANNTGSLNIATGVAETLKNLVNYIEAAGGEKSTIEYQAPRPGDIVKSYAATKKAWQELQFKASVSLADGIKLQLAIA